jgi:hypothetical protein
MGGEQLVRGVFSLVGGGFGFGQSECEEEGF